MATTSASPPSAAQRPTSTSSSAHSSTPSNTSEARAAAAFGLSLFGAPPSASSPRSSPRSPEFTTAPNQSPVSPLAREVSSPRGGEGMAEEADGEADVRLLIQNGWSERDARDIVAQEMSRGNIGHGTAAAAIYSPTEQGTSSPESWKLSPTSPPPRQYSSADLFPTLAPLPTPSLDKSERYESASPQTNHLRALEELEQSAAWRGMEDVGQEHAVEEPYAEPDHAFDLELVQALASVDPTERRRYQRRIIDQLVAKRDADRVAAAREQGKSLGAESRRIWRHLDRAQMEAGPNPVNGYNLSLEARYRQLQSPPPLSPRTPSMASPSARPQASIDEVLSSDPRQLPQNETELFDSPDARVDLRSDTPLPRSASAPPPNSRGYAPPVDDPYAEDARRKPFHTLGGNFLPLQDRYSLTHTEMTGRVLDLGDKRTLHRDRIGTAWGNWGRTVLSPIPTESELTAASIHSGLSSPALSSSSRITVTSSPRRPPSDPLSAAAYERSRRKTTSLTAVALQSLDTMTDVAAPESSGSRPREPKQRKRRPIIDEDVDNLDMGGLDALAYAKKTMLEEFGIDLDRDDGPSPPYESRHGKSSSAGRSGSTRSGTGRDPEGNEKAKYLPEGLVGLLREYVRMRESPEWKRDAAIVDAAEAAALASRRKSKSRLPDEYRSSKPFPSSRVEVRAAQVDPASSAALSLEAVTSIDPSTTPPTSPPARKPPTSHVQPDGVRRRSRSASTTASKYATPPDIFHADVEEAANEAVTVASLPFSPDNPAEEELPRRPSSSPPKQKSPPRTSAETLEERTQRKSSRKEGAPPNAEGARHAGRDDAQARLLEFNKEYIRLLGKLPGDPQQYAVGHVPVLNAIGSLLIGLGDLATPAQRSEAEYYLEQSLLLDFGQPEIAVAFADACETKAHDVYEEDPERSSDYNKRALYYYRAAADLTPTNALYHMRVAHSLMHQLEPADPGESNEQLAVHALQRAIESAPEVTDTRIMAFFRVGQTYARIAQKTMDEDPLKSDLYEMALMGFEDSMDAYTAYAQADPQIRPPRTGEIPKRQEIEARWHQTSAEFEDFKLVASALGRPAGSRTSDVPSFPRRATEPAATSQSRKHSASPTLIGSPVHMDGHASALKARRRDTPITFSPTQQDVDDGAPSPKPATIPAAFTPPAPRTRQERSELKGTKRVAEILRGVSDLVEHESPKPRELGSRTRTVGVQVGKTRRPRDARTQTEPLLGSHSAPYRPHEPEPYDHASVLIDQAILTLQSLLALSQERQAQRIARETTEVRDSLNKLQEEILAHIAERTAKAEALTHALQEVLKELQGMPERVEATARLINSRPETAWPVAPPTNPLKFTLAKLLKAKEASKALKRKKV